MAIFCVSYYNSSCLSEIRIRAGRVVARAYWLDGSPQLSSPLNLQFLGDVLTKLRLSRT
jgi:hypothetical protein